MLELIIKGFFAIYIIRLVLKHNLFIHYLKISIKFIGLDIEIKSKEKSAPSFKE
ncbi:hypothetical protein [Clostridium ihumii]|uniref:hypothetical protein n=1 Tax=Clostridium ihumii TaxID=1470356 RepID=UPI0013924924|nr:hypothetical protein [Clostridium ihumii]